MQQNAPQAQGTTGGLGQGQSYMIVELNLGPNEPSTGPPETFTGVFDSQDNLNNHDEYNETLALTPLETRDPAPVVPGFDEEFRDAQHHAQPPQSTNVPHPPHDLGLGFGQGTLQAHALPDPQATAMPMGHLSNFNTPYPHAIAMPTLHFPNLNTSLLPPMNSIPPPGALPFPLWVIPNHTTGHIDLVSAVYPLHPLITKGCVATFLGIPEMVTTDSSPGAIASIAVHPPPSSSLITTATSAQVAARESSLMKEKAAQDPPTPETMVNFVSDIRQALSISMRTEERITSFTAIVQEFMSALATRMPDDIIARMILDYNPRSPIAGPSRHADAVWPAVETVEEEPGQHPDFFFMAPYTGNRGDANTDQGF